MNESFIIIWEFSISVASASTSVPSCHPYMDCCLYLWPKLLNTPTPQHIHSSVYIKFHCSTETQIITNKEGSMRSGFLSIILSLAVTAYCVPLSQVTVQDERFAEVRSIFFTLDCISSQHFELYDLVCVWKFCFSTNNKNHRQLHLNSTPLILIFSQSYLKNFFNLTEERGPGTRRGISPLTRKLSEMQRFFGLQITGTLDDDTINMMKKPRCGVPDGKLARFSTFGRNLKWEKEKLTYR